MFDVQSLRSGYGEMSVLKDLTFSVSDEIFAVLGANGAGKTTLLKTLARLLPLQAGSLSLNGADVSRSPAYAMPDAGVAYVPQEENVFPDLSVQENLSIGGRTGHRTKAEKIEEVFALFPRLKERRGQAAGSLSGGEGQMLAVGRALMQDPKVLLLDEPSAGLSPLFVDALFSSIAETRKERGLTIVLAEQNAVKTLEIADRVMVLSLGEMHLLRPRSELQMSDITAAYHI
ncbi:ABC transporter ATP-binding protein [uncultured Tateyamaria sp.]|uniref:ABC transporter ATP-binding protein n=1 Tax=uncultured Tateyamaria sp. TaxID=455651 RepID=UPI00260B6AD5|nr:ABC transporter ATP-binding protein [uncultured Tateyamaria sp.]